MTVRTRSATADGGSWAIASQAARRSHARASGASPSVGRPFGERVIVSSRLNRSCSARDGRGIALLIRRVVRAPDCRGAGAPPAGAGVAAVRAAGRRDAGALPAEARLAVLGADRLLVLRRRRRAWAIAPKIAGEGRGAPFCGGYS